MGTLESHKLNASEINESELEVDCEEHDDERCHIKVVQRPGFVCSLEAHARLPMSPVRAWEILCHPDNAEIFRHIDRCIYRKVLLNEFPILKFEVVHEATYKFLVFKGRFHTRLHVDENHETYESSFRLLPLRGLFKQFEGESLLSCARCYRHRDMDRACASMMYAKRYGGYARWSLAYIPCRDHG